MEVILRTQDGSKYLKFELPLAVEADDDGWNLSSDYDYIGCYKERKHAVHVMNYLLAQRNYYMYDEAASNYKSVILNVPTDEVARQTKDEDLLDGMPVKKEGDAD